MCLENKVKTAIERLKMADEMSRKYMGSPLYVCISGGKDSSTIQQLAIESGLEMIFTNNHTTVDAPETVYFIRNEFKRLQGLGYKTQILYPKMSMWQLIESKNGLPPLRTMRYCCRYFKERTVRTEDGKPAFIVTGVRWAESANRKKRTEFEAIASKAANAVRVAANDNDISRKLFEDCRLRSERVCNPIIDWTDEDVWEYLRDRKVPYNPLYDEGFTRIGCIGCPMASKEQRERQFERWPKYKEAYIRAIDKGIQRGKALGKEYTWTGGEEALRFLDT
jgi:phosphoadenosine phosphosulfate reductase